MAGIQVGSVVDGKYEVIRVIGRGGMSVVWLAQDKRLGKLWAVKEIKPNVRGLQGAVNRQAIIDEANFMKRLDHPAIPRVVDILDTGDTIFVVMDYVNGTALDKVLAEQGTPFDQEEVIDWGIQLCDVLGYLHGMRPPVVYRDMKPSNVMLRDDDSVKLIDFGISLELTPGAAESAQRIGSAGYSAPEQIEAEAHKLYPIDERADVYALGATLYTLVTGHTPRRVGSGDKTTVDFDMRPIRELNPQLSDGLEQILLRATQRVPDDRYQTIEDMRYDLEHYEVLTAEWRAAQQKKVDTFWGQVRASGIALAVSAALLGGSFLVRNSSYDALMHDASLASTDERNVVLASQSENGRRTSEPSEAEEYYLRAIEIASDRVEPYQKLIETYKADDVFTPTESERWVSTWQRYGRDIRDDEKYARLCYDVGIAYLCYYDFLGVRDMQGSASDSISGQAALENASRSSVWFRNALEACNVEEGEYRGLQVDDDLDEYTALLAYQTIGDFHDKITKANREGANVNDTYEQFWEAITEAVEPGGIADKAEPIVQLRLYQVAFESVSSANNLSGFRRAGISQDQAKDFLDLVEERTSALKPFIESNEVVAGPIGEEIVAGEKEARNNILRTYNSPTARLSGSSEDGEG